MYGRSRHASKHLVAPSNYLSKGEVVFSIGSLSAEIGTCSLPSLDNQVKSKSTAPFDGWLIKSFAGLRAQLSTFGCVKQQTLHTIHEKRKAKVQGQRLMESICLQKRKEENETRTNPEDCRYTRTSSRDCRRREHERAKGPRRNKLWITFFTLVRIS